MTKLPVLLSACVVGLLLAGPAAAESLTQRHALGADAPGAAAQLRLTGTTSAGVAQAGYVPLARRLTGTGVLSLDVFQYSGAPEVDADVDWSVSAANGDAEGTGLTNAAGHVDLTGVPGANANGTIQIRTHDGSATYGLTSLTWPDAGEGVGPLAPGRIPLSISRSNDGRFNDWQEATIHLQSNPGVQTHLADTTITSTSPTFNGYALTFSLGAEELTRGSVHFWPNEGLELPSVKGVTVFPATQTSAFALDIDERDAQRIWCSSRGSGAPGTGVDLILDGYPALWENTVFGYAWWPQSSVLDTLGTRTMTGAGSEKMRLTIPRSAAPGYRYSFLVSHKTGPLTLETTFQTCTLKPSRASIGSGSAIRLSGIVPVMGHEGDVKGTGKTVVVYETASAAIAKHGQPSKAGGPAKVGGWTRLTKTSASGLGKYATGSIRPARTTWYTVWYPKDKWYRAAYTSLARVSVK